MVRLRFDLGGVKCDENNLGKLGLIGNRTVDWFLLQSAQTISKSPSYFI